MIYRIFRPLFFLLPTETAHYLTLELLRWLPQVCWPTIPPHPKTVMGLQFANPIGLAAGLDKNGDYIDALAKLGFGFIEIGSITPRPQAGNPKPRLFRLVKQQALINRMGFNNKGVDYLVGRLKTMKYRGIIGVNIGKNIDTPIERAIDDYRDCFEKVYAYASYVTINISSPNTPGLRELQYGDLLDQLLASLKQLQHQLQQKHQRYVPLVLKISPDEDANVLQTIVEYCLKHQIDGIIATNTTMSRQGVEDDALAKQQGGLSGQPLTQKASAVVKQLQDYCQGQIPIIAAGGVMSANDANAKLTAGASLLQVYTGLIYKGPGLIAELRRVC